MAFKYIALFAFVAVASAGLLPYHQPTHLVEHHVEHHEAPAEYKFEYSVHDEHTGDIKEQQETRHGDNVEGHYSLVEADGHRRIVHYTADEHNGFNAKVEREYIGHHAPQQIVTKKIYAAPAVHHVAPVVHHAPAVQHVAYHAPAVHHVAPAVKHVSYQAPSVHHVSHHAPTLVHAAPAHYAHHGDAHSSVSVQSHAVNYHY